MSVALMDVALVAEEEKDMRYRAMSCSLQSKSSLSLSSASGESCRVRLDGRSLFSSVSLVVALAGVAWSVGSGAAVVCDA